MDRINQVELNTDGVRQPGQHRTKDDIGKVWDKGPGQEDVLGRRRLVSLVVGARGRMLSHLSCNSHAKGYGRKYNSKYSGVP